MSLAPRWRKVLRDILRNPTRSVLVVISIAVGVIAVAMVAGGFSTFYTDLPVSFKATNPYHILIRTEPFDSSLVKSIERMPEVESAAGQRSIVVQARVGDDRWQELHLTAIDDFNDQKVGIVSPQAGQWPPGEMEMLVERSSLDALGVQAGDPLTIKIDDAEKTLKVVGSAHDLSAFSTNLSGIAYGYITYKTLEKLGAGWYFDTLAVRVAGDSMDRAHNEAVADAVVDKVERAGFTVEQTTVPKPNQHRMEQFLTPMLLILGAMGILSLLLSGFLVVNIITALMAQQTRQIGVMKAVGASSVQVARMYVFMVFVYGVLAMAVALPLGYLVTRWFTDFAAALVNFDVVSPPLTWPIVLLLIVSGVGVPVVAAFIPILRGTRVTVREAITDFGAGAGAGVRSRLDRWIEAIPWLTRPQSISLRNTFRKRGRLILTLATLTLASAIFIGVFGVRSSLYRTVNDAFDYWNYDVSVDMSRPYRADYLEKVATDIPSVSDAEAWGIRRVTRQRPNDTESDSISLIAPQPGSQLIDPIVLEGRWLLPDDDRAIVINADLLNDEPDLAVGDSIDLNIDDDETTWTIVGVVRSVLAGASAYVNYPAFSEAVHEVGQGNTLNVVLEDRSPENQRVMRKVIEDRFDELGLRTSLVEATVDKQKRIGNQFDILILFLVIMAVTLAIVGGLGLMGAMSINVLERRREIGIMRSIGASTAAVMRIVILEGIIIGFLSWLIGAVVAWPLSKLLSDAVGAGFIHSVLTYAYSYSGAAMWLLIMTGIASLASFLPARQAARMTVREVLAYE